MKTTPCESRCAGITRLEALLALAVLCVVGWVAWRTFTCYNSDAEDSPSFGETRMSEDGATTSLSSLWRRLFGRSSTQETTQAGTESRSAVGTSVSERATARIGESSSVMTGSEMSDSDLLEEAEEEGKPPAVGVSASAGSAGVVVASARKQKKTAPTVEEPAIPALEAFKEAIESADPLAEFGLDKIRKLSLADVQECVKLTETMEWGPEANQLLQTLMTRWVTLDPQSAGDYAMTIDSRRTRGAVLTSVLSSWSESDPEQALAWFLQTASTNPKAMATNVRTLFRNLADYNVAWALAQTWLLPSQAMKSTAIRTVVDKMARINSTDSLIHVYENMAPGADRTMLAEALVENWTRYQPGKAASWILTTIQDPLEQNRAIDRLITAWGFDQPEDAAEWVESLPVGNLRRAELGKVAQLWGQDDIMAAADWVSHFPPSPQIDLAVQNIALGLRKQDPETAMSWAESITETRIRFSTMEQVAYEWIRQDPNTARDYIVASPLSGPTKRRLLRTLPPVK